MRIALRRVISIPALLLLAAIHLASPAQAQNTMVRLHTTQGLVDLALLNSEAPLTVANFLLYVRGGDYTDVFVHRSVPNFVIQTGGFKWPESGCCPAVDDSRGMVANEFSTARSNVRGTVAMAKRENQPNSATSQWFVNMIDNSANLDFANGGYTVFARVTAPGMVVADRIAALPVVNVGDALTHLPVSGWPGGNAPVQRQHVVRLTGITEFPAYQSETDRLFNYLEAAYPLYLSPPGAATGTFDGYLFRHYSATNIYVGSKDSKLWYYAPGIDGAVHDLGSFSTWLAEATAAGY